MSRHRSGCGGSKRSRQKKQTTPEQRQESASKSKWVDYGMGEPSEGQAMLRWQDLASGESRCRGTYTEEYNEICI